jgi:hypothetical protein
MATINQSAQLLDDCVELAIAVGTTRATEGDATEKLNELRQAIDEYIASTWFMPENERPSREHVTKVMVRNAYLSYLFTMGQLPVENVPEAFKILEQLHPEK